MLLSVPGNRKEISATRNRFLYIEHDAIMVCSMWGSFSDMVGLKATYPANNAPHKVDSELLTIKRPFYIEGRNGFLKTKCSCCGRYPIAATIHVVAFHHVSSTSR